MKSLLTVMALALVYQTARAEKATVKLSDVNTTDDTSIVVKKGDVQNNCTEYTIVEGKEEVFGSPDYDRGKAYVNWKTACGEWKQSMRDLNKENAILSLHCTAPAGSKDGDQWLFKGAGNYKVKTKIKEKGKN